MNRHRSCVVFRYSLGALSFSSSSIISIYRVVDTGIYVILNRSQFNCLSCCNGWLLVENCSIYVIYISKLSDNKFIMSSLWIMQYYGTSPSCWWCVYTIFKPCVSSDSPPLPWDMPDDRHWICGRINALDCNYSFVNFKLSAVSIFFILIFSSGLIVPYEA